MAEVKARLCSGNGHKLDELRASLPGWQLELLPLDVDETGATYEDNARLKARAGREVAAPDEWVLGEDSGIECDALAGGPGVQSARWAPAGMPVELRGDVARFCCGIIDAVAPYVVAVKPQVAFFEALGGDGMSALERVCDYGRAAGLLVIADGKRGDIGSTARAYAAAYLEPRDEQGPLADALTVNTYLGGDSVEPFLQACSRA